MTSPPEPGTESNPVPTPAPPRPKTFWMGHVALILLAAVVAAIFADRGNLLRAASTWIPALMVVLFVAQILIARRANGALGNGVGYGLCAAGALSMMAANLVASKSLVLAFSLLSAVLFLSGTVVLIAQFSKIARSREV